MTEKKMIYTQLLSLPCMIYENGSEQNTCTKLVNMSSTCISWLAQSCFPSAPPCLWIQTWEIFRIQTCLKPLSSIAHQNIMWVCVASDPPRSIQRDELLRGSTNEEHLGSGLWTQNSPWNFDICVVKDLSDLTRKAQFQMVHLQFMTPATNALRRPRGKPFGNDHV